MSCSRSWWVLLLVFLAGCGSSTYPVEGRVVFKGDGQPLRGGSVEFEPIDPDGRASAWGAVDEEGRFRLTTFQPGDGAIAGEHRVLVMPPSPSPEELGRMATPRSSLVLDERYTSYETSGLRFTVTRDASKNKFQLEVERPSGPGAPPPKKPRP